MTKRKRTAAAVSRPKQYVLDTNVLLHDPQSIFQFHEHTVWIPVEVLEELDRFKAESTTRGANAREVHRKLSERFRNRDDMERGVDLANGGRMRVALEAAAHYGTGRLNGYAHSDKFVALGALFPDLQSADNRILAAAAYVADSNATAPTILVTKDLNMQLKAKALGLEAQDYKTDRVEDNDIRRTQRNVDEDIYDVLDVPGHTLQAFASQGHVAVDNPREFLANEYVLIRNGAQPVHGIPARHTGGGEFVRLRSDSVCIRNGRTIKAANLGQHFLLDALFDPEISLVSVYGKAGTGKTLLCVGAALEQVQAGLYEKLLITRVIMPTGRDIGYLPGRMEEKMQPWIQPACDALEFLLTKPKRPEQFSGRKQSGRKSGKQPADLQPTYEAVPHSANGNGKMVRPWEHLMHNGTIEIEAITHIRGRSIPNAIFIVDEAQQLTPHEAKTLVTRMGRGSKLILLGDLAQIDNPYVDAHSNGLVYTRNKLEGQHWMAHVNLFKGERSEMADTAANLM